ncbi:hypothetical protein ACOSP7_014807 [Xanthoceras sorbifolium]
MENLPGNLLPDEASPAWLNKGDNPWQLTAATLVSLQSIPGLVILYGSMVKKKWALNSAFMAIYAFAMVIVCWVGWGFRMSFGDKLVDFLGKPGGVFACITLVLIAGALIRRMNFRAWVMFVPLWLTCSYTVAAFSIWCPDGWLAKLGVIDFAGGYVIHVSAGVAGFTASCWVGPRTDKDREITQPNNIIMMLAGVRLLWMGWSGFNGGAPFAVSSDASLAVLNTHVCTATSLLTWLLLDTFFSGKPSVIGVVQGIITGLVCITPGTRVVQGWAALLMGVISGSVPWYTMRVLHNKVKFFQLIDDPLAVFHTHAIAGILGGVLCRAQIVSSFLHGILFVVCLNIVITSIICLFIRLIVPLRMSEEELHIGDESVHGEKAFALFADKENYQKKLNFVYDVEDQEEPSHATSRSIGEVQMV